MYYDAVVNIIHKRFLSIEGTLCSFGEDIHTPNLNIYNINGMIIQTQKYVFFLK